MIGPNIAKINDIVQDNAQINWKLNHIIECPDNEIIDSQKLGGAD